MPKRRRTETLEELREELRKIAEREIQDPEDDHRDADTLLLYFIKDREVLKQYRRIKKWYA